MLRDDIRWDTVELQLVKELSMEGVCEMAAVKLTYTEISWTILGLYRPPSEQPSLND